MATDSSHTARPTPKASADTGEAFGERVHQESANCVNDNCNESFEPEHASMMSLSGSNGKTGKCGYPACQGEVAAFSRLFNSPALGYGDRTMTKNKPVTIRDLYPHMSEAELAVAQANLKRYVALLVRIHDRLKGEGKSWPDSPVNLTASEMHRTIPGERSNSPKERN
jgi:hypothetical protein